MRLCNSYLPLLVALAAERTTAFSLDLVPRRSKLAVAPQHHQRSSALFGILDEINTGSGASAAPDDSDEDEKQYEDLYNDLIFATGDTRTVIANRLDSIHNEDFLQWLEWQMEESDDDEEAQALQDLLELIDQVITETDANNQQKEQERQEKQAKRQQEIEAQIASENFAASTTSGTEGTSAADLLKKANAIDQAVMVAEASDDEKPDDFMRDAKAERGLGGFNNKGRMRVGGG